MIYSLCSALLLIGVLGLLSQVLLGGAHAGHMGHGGHAGASHGGHAGHGHAGSGRASSPLWTLLSPLAFFSLCLGAGATGLLLKHLHLPLGLVVGAVLLGGAVFYGLIIRPLWNVLFRFASTPSTSLAGTVAHEAEALTRFDAAGKGLVRVTVDGQLVRILATLEPEDRAEGAVRPGDRLTITSVDGHTNSCRVARL